jgi:hypothetical protein
LPEENPNGDWQVATADYLETMRIPLIAAAIHDIRHNAVIEDAREEMLLARW